MSLSVSGGFVFWGRLSWGLWIMNCLCDPGCWTNCLSWTGSNFQRKVKKWFQEVRQTWTGTMQIPWRLGGARLVRLSWAAMVHQVWEGVLVRRPSSWSLTAWLTCSDVITYLFVSMILINFQFKSHEVCWTRKNNVYSVFVEKLFGMCVEFGVSRIQFI